MILVIAHRELKLGAPMAKRNLPKAGKKEVICPSGQRTSELRCERLAAAQSEMGWSQLCRSQL